MPKELDTLEIKKYRPEFKESWDSFAREAKNATFLFQRDFMDYHSHRFDDYSLIVYKSEKISALLPANYRDGVLHSHQGLSYGGLLLSNKTTFQEALSIFRKLLSFLEGEGIERLHLKSVPKIYHQLPSDEMDYLLFLTKAHLIRRDLSCCVSNENPIKIGSSNRLRGIKKAIKNGLELREEPSFDAFWKEVLEPNLKQVHGQKPVHSLEEISSLKSLFPNNIRQFNIYQENQVVAGATIFETEKVAHAQYISANERGRKTGGLDFLFDGLLKQFAHKKYFDFGISNESQGMKVNKGLLQWKESFGGRGIVHDFYEVPTANHKLLNTVFI